MLFGAVTASTIAPTPNDTGLENKANAFLAGLTSHQFVWVSCIADDLARVQGSEFKVVFSYVPAAPIATPFKLRVFTSRSQQGIAEQAQAFAALNPTFFVSEVYALHTPSARRSSPEFGFIFYNETASAGANWGRSGGGGDATFTNAAPTTATVGGIPAGSTFPAPQTMQQMWDALLYPYLNPAFTSFGISGEGSPREVGDAIPASVTFTWATSNSGNVQPNSIGLLDVTRSDTLATGLANDGSQAVTQPGGQVVYSTEASHTYRVAGQNTHAGSFQRDVTFSWRFRLFFGNQAAATLTEAQIEGLADSVLTSTYAGDYACGAGGYKYFCFSDDAGGQVNSVKDPSTGFDVPLATVAENAAYSHVDGGGFAYALVSVTNAFGVTTDYRVYRTKNPLGGALTLRVTGT